MDAIILNPEDNVAVTLKDVIAGESVQIGDETLRALENIPSGHKIARRDIPDGGYITKYGMTVGRAVSEIKKGGHVHVHNIASVYMDNAQDHYE